MPGKKNHSCFVGFIVAVFMLPNITKAIAQQSNHHKIAGKDYSNYCGQHAKKTVVDLITADDYPKILCPIACQFFLRIVMR